MIILSGRRALAAASTAIAAFAGSLVALRYRRLGLTLSHYDSRGHLLVARRIIATASRRAGSRSAPCGSRCPTSSTCFLCRSISSLALVGPPYDFLHESNWDIWLAALAEGPRPFAKWVLIEENAQGGDMLARRARERPHFLDCSRVCEGAGLELYRRDDHQNLTLNTSR